MQRNNETLKLPCLRYPTEEERAAADEARTAARSRTAPLLGDEHSPQPPVVAPTALKLPLGQASPTLLRVREFFTPTLSRFTLQKS